MDIGIAKQIGDDRDKRQRKPEKRTVLDICAAKRIGVKFVWLSVPDCASAQRT